MAGSRVNPVTSVALWIGKLMKKLRLLPEDPSPRWNPQYSTKLEEIADVVWAIAFEISFGGRKPDGYQRHVLGRSRGFYTDISRTCS